MLNRSSSTARSSRPIMDDEVDDETFLKSPRFSQPISPHSPSTSISQQRYDNWEDQKTQLMNQRKEIENKTLESTRRSLHMLRDSEEVGIATAEELARQREQLENTDARLNEIHDNLHSTSKHIQGISSIFGSIKNYWSSRKSENRGDRIPESTRSASVDASTPKTRRQLHNALERASTNVDVDEHPALYLRGISTSNSNSKSSTDSVELDHNINEMSNALSRLKGLANDLGHELDSQNHLLEDVIAKTEKADINIDKQNKDIKRILRK